MDFIFTEASTIDKDNTLPSEYTFFSALWKQQLSNKTADIIRCGSNTCMVDKILSTMQETTGNRAFIHYDNINVQSRGIEPLLSVIEAAHRVASKVYLLKYESFEHLILCTGVLQDILQLDHTHRESQELLKYISFILDCLENRDYSAIPLSTSYKILFPDSKNLSIETIISSCCSRASAGLHGLFAIRKRKLGKCWTVSCDPVGSNCNLPAVPNLAICHSKDRALFLLHRLNANTVYDLYAEHIVEASIPYSSVFEECGITEPEEQARLLEKIKEAIPSCIRGAELDQKMPNFIRSYLGK